MASFERRGSSSQGGRRSGSEFANRGRSAEKTRFFDRKPRDGASPRGFSSSRGDSEKYSITCSACGRPSEVPFKPTNGGPLFCAACFRKEKPPRFATNNPGDLEEINRKLDKILAILSR